MDISNINNNNGNIWKGLQDAIETLGSLKGAEDVGTVFGADGTNLSVTFTGTDGVARTIQLDLPELEEGATAPDPEVIGALIDKIDEMFADLEAQAAPSVEKLEEMVKATGANAQSTGFRKALFDVYSLMCLMVDLATAQREVARNLRQQELIGQVASIKAKAEAQRTAALIGMLVSVGLTIGQIVCSSVAAKLAGKASDAATKTGDAMGLNAAKTDLKILNEAVDTKAASLNAAKYGKIAGPDIKKQVDAGLASALDKVAVPETTQAEVKTAQVKVETATAKIATCEKQLTMDQATLDGKKVQLSSLKNELEALDQKVANGGKLSEKEVARRAELNQSIPTMESEISTAEGKLNALQEAKGDLVNAKAKLEELKTRAAGELKTETGKALDSVMQKADSEYTKAQSDLKALKSAEKPDKAAIAKQEKVVKEAGKARDYTRALVTHKKLELGISLGNDLKVANAKVQNLENVIKDDSEFKAHMAKSAQWMMLSQMASQMQGLISSMSNFFSSLEQEVVAEKESEVSRRQSYQQESTELQESAQKLLDSVLQTLRELVQMESGSLDRIIGNI